MSCMEIFLSKSGTFTSCHNLQTKPHQLQRSMSNTIDLCPRIITWDLLVFITFVFSMFYRLFGDDSCTRERQGQLTGSQEIVGLYGSKNGE